MKLILLYGPPAIGKLTIGKEIARLRQGLRSSMCTSLLTWLRPFSHEVHPL
jgi:tRNA uridine 5-carbamoylmethylation protein Kti12